MNHNIDNGISIEWILIAQKGVQIQPVFSNKNKFELDDIIVSAKVLREIYSMPEYEDYKTGKIRSKALVRRFVEEKCLGEDLRYSEYLELFEQGIEPVDGIKHIIHALSHHYTLASLANEGKEFFEYQGRHSGMDKYFRKNIVSADLKTLQPEEKFYRSALKKIGAKPEECLIIDSDERHCEMAENLGIRSIYFQNSDRLEEELLARRILPSKTNIRFDYL